MRKQTTSRPDNVYMSDASKRKEKQQWPSRNPNSIMPEDCVVFTSMILMMRNKGIMKMRVESCKFQCQQQCLAKLHCAGVAGNPAALLENTRQNTFVLLKPMNLWEVRLEGAPHGNHEDHIAGKGMNSFSRYNQVHKIFLCLKQ